MCSLAVSPLWSPPILTFDPLLMLGFHPGRAPPELILRSFIKLGPTFRSDSLPNFSFFPLDTICPWTLVETVTFVGFCFVVKLPLLRKNEIGSLRAFNSSSDR